MSGRTMDTAPAHAAGMLLSTTRLHWFMACLLALFMGDAHPASVERPDAAARQALRKAIADADSFYDRFHAEVWLTDMAGRLADTVADPRERMDILRHVHSEALWQTLKGDLPTTADDIAYGTPGMAREFQRIFRETAFAADGVAVMGGHENGLVSMGGSVKEACERILALSA